MHSGEGPKRNPKKWKTSKTNKNGEGTEGTSVSEPGVKDSQTFEGFRKRTMNSLVAKGHLRHLREHYSISPKVQMRVPLEGESVDVPLEEGYTPVFWEFFNYGMRLRASPFFDSLLCTIGCAPGQLGPFAWATVMAFQVGCLSVGVVPSVNLFTRIFNVVHHGVLTYFHPKPGVKNMLYSEKPGKPLRLKAFCDPEVVVKAGLCKGPNHYPDITLGDLLLAKTELAPTPSKVSYKAVASGVS
ncbi:hypothetical protein LIER_21747 [Lithospermum erythrorhizon]|uniref:Transposase (putative) gypsy type domain-containing protein n=1 Tax=Lithospermum erythrorhizon TaxID=34254 RepID=A0AAV3QSW2_LITER